MTRKRKTKTIRSDPDTVKRLLTELAEREATRPPPPVYRTRRYVNAPDAKPGWPCQGGLPSLGEGY